MKLWTPTEYEDLIVAMTGPVYEQIVLDDVNAIHEWHDTMPNYEDRVIIVKQFSQHLHKWTANYRMADEYREMLEDNPGYFERCHIHWQYSAIFDDENVNVADVLAKYSIEAFVKNYKPDGYDFSGLTNKG